jgi:hypothetical protein
MLIAFWRVTSVFQTTYGQPDTYHWAGSVPGSYGSGETVSTRRSVHAFLFVLKFRQKYLISFYICMIALSGLHSLCPRFDARSGPCEQSIFGSRKMLGVHTLFGNCQVLEKDFTTRTLGELVTQLHGCTLILCEECRLLGGHAMWLL